MLFQLYENFLHAIHGVRITKMPICKPKISVFYV